MKVTEKQLTVIGKCQCGNGFGEADQAFISHKNLRILGYKRHNSTCYSKTITVDTCDLCTPNHDNDFYSQD